MSLNQLLRLSGRRLVQTRQLLSQLQGVRCSSISSTLQDEDKLEFNDMVLKFSEKVRYEVMHEYNQYIAPIVITSYQ